MNQENKQTDHDSSKKPLPSTEAKESPPEPLLRYNCLTIMLQEQDDLENSLKKK